MTSKPTETELLPERMTLDSIPQAVYHVVRWYSETFERVPLKEEFEGIEAVLRQHFAPQPTLQQSIECVKGLRDKWRRIRDEEVSVVDKQSWTRFAHYMKAADEVIAALSSLASTEPTFGCEHCSCTCDNCAPCGSEDNRP